MISSNHIFRRALFAGIAGTAAAVLAMPACAQSRPTSVATEPSQLDEVIVTSTRVETNLQRTPVAVTAITANVLRERGASSLLDITNYAPSLSIGSRSGAGGSNGGFSLRGMGVDATNGSAAVGIYVDEVYFPSGPGNLLGLFDVDRLEVLRGPQGTLFGRNTIAGAIQYITKKPEHRLGGYVDVVGGSFNRTDIQAAINAPLGDTLALRLSGASNTRSGYVHDELNGSDRGSDRTRQARLQVRWTPTPRLTVDLKAETLRERTNGRALVVTGINPNAQFVGLARLFGETRPLTTAYVSKGQYSFPGFNSADFFHFDYSEAQGVVRYDLTDSITFKSITAISSSRSRTTQDIDQSPLQIISANGGLITTDLFTQEGQLSGRSFGDRLRWTAGLYYYDSRQETRGQRAQVGFFPLPPSGDPRTDVKAEAAYGQATYNLTSQLSATVGLRYSKEENRGLLIGLTNPGTSTFSNTSPHFGLNYQLDEAKLLYVKASRGFRAGGYTPDGNLPGGGLAFGPETAWTYEAGARLELLDRRLRINPTVFYTSWKDIQFNLLIPTATTVVVATNNAGDANIRGFELESQFAVTDRLLLTGSLSVLDAQYTRVPNLTHTIFPLGFPGPAVQEVNLTKATPLQRTPEYKVALGARYTHPLSGGARIVGSVDAAWTDKQRSAVTITESVELPAYSTANARLQYDAPGDRWSAAAFVTNLTDAYYLIGGADFAAGYTTGTVERDPARPREFGVQLTLRY